MVEISIACFSFSKQFLYNSSEVMLLVIPSTTSVLTCARLAIRMQAVPFITVASVSTINISTMTFASVKR